MQGKGICSKLLSFAETLAPIVEIDVVSCRTDLFPLYERLGFKEVQTFPAEDHIPVDRLTRSGLTMVVMNKKSKLCTSNGA